MSPIGSNSAQNFAVFTPISIGEIKQLDGHIATTERSVWTPSLGTLSALLSDASQPWRSSRAKATWQEVNPLVSVYCRETMPTRSCLGNPFRGDIPSSRWQNSSHNPRGQSGDHKAYLTKATSKVESPKKNLLNVNMVMEQCKGYAMCAP